LADRNIGVTQRYSKFVTREGMELYVPPSDLVTIGSIPPTIDPWRTNDVTQRFPLGSKLVYGERAFRYTLMGAVAGIAGSLYQSVVPLAGHIDEVVDSAAADGTTIAFTPNTCCTDDLTADELADGYIYINDDTGEGYVYAIRTHPAITGGASGNITLRDPVVVTLGANATATVLHNPFRSVIIHPAPPTAPIVGCCIAVVTAARFCWLQTAGPVAVKTEGVIVIGELVGAADAAVNGAVAPADENISDGCPPTGHGERVLGYVMAVNATLEHSLINLQLDHV